MRAKQPRLVITFHTTAAAMAAEQLCRREGLEGRLISVPRQLTSDCGIAWAADPALRERLAALLQGAAIETEGFYDLLM